MKAPTMMVEVEVGVGVGVKVEVKVKVERTAYCCCCAFQRCCKMKFINHIPCILTRVTLPNTNITVGFSKEPLTWSHPIFIRMNFMELVYNIVHSIK